MNSPRWKPYPQTKASGIEWLGEIPAHWETRRMKYVADTPIRNGIGEAGEFDDPSWPRYIRITDIAGPRRLRDDTFKSLPPEVAAQSPFEIGDILLAAVGATFGRSYFHVLDIGPVCFAGYLARFAPGAAVDPGFASYWTESAFYWAQVQSRVVQATIQNFSAAKYRDLTMPLPHRAEQQTIADFLDRETGKIDALVEKKERLIELLQEKRTALITRAVTEGLDPNVPMKDSGTCLRASTHRQVEWLGQSPAHWEVKRNALLFDQRDERGYPDLPILNVSIASGVQIREFSDERIEQQASDPGTYKRARAGDITFNKMRMWQGAVGVAPVDGLVSPDYTVAIPRPGTCARYFAMLFRTSLHMAKVYCVSHGIVDDRNRLYWEGFKDIDEPYPPPGEQIEIAEHVDRETAKIDALVAKVREAIERLKEYRTALISATVTGKIDVRGV